MYYCGKTRNYGPLGGGEHGLPGPQTPLEKIPYKNIALAFDGVFHNKYVSKMTALWPDKLVRAG